MSIKTFNEFLQETSLSRQWYHFTDVKHEAGIMSAFRAQYRDRPEVQAARTLELAGKISSAGFGYVFADGHFVEEGPNGTKIPVEETSVIINGGTDGKLKGFMRKWRSEYDQDSVIYKPDGSTHIFALSASGETDIGEFHPGHIGDNMTQLRGRSHGTFVFEQAWGTMNFFGHLLYDNLKRHHGREFAQEEFRRLRRLNETLK